MRNIFCIWEFKGRMLENLNFGKTGFNTCVLEKHFISYSCIYSLYSMLWWVFSKTRLFFSKILFFPEFWLIQSVFRSIKITFKIFCELLSISINRNWFSINRKSWISFFKSQIWLIQITFSKLVQTPFSLSDLDKHHP